MVSYATRKGERNEKNRVKFVRRNDFARKTRENWLCHFHFVLMPLVKAIDDFEIAKFVFEYLEIKDDPSTLLDIQKKDRP